MAESSPPVSIRSPSGFGAKHWGVVGQILDGFVFVLKWFILAILGLGILSSFFSSPSGHFLAKANAAMQTSRTIALCLYQYSIDHGGAYPTGKSSTEIFQKLIDGKYVTDPSIFYVPYADIPGKKGTSSDTLKPENVSWDVTVPVDGNSPEGLPIVFLTGYRITYAPGASAVPLSKSFPDGLRGIPVCYKSNSAWFKKNNGLPDGTVANFIPADFNPAGKKFQQLTPDGPLAP
jgi:hypothetical protein